MKFVSSISSLPISAQSAAFAPTNSADVSAIASAYQVVSATATQLYAGTAYLTGVNGAPVSASRAGNAANASIANSAYYDGTGRFISALPDSATVSAIASSYAESAASGKQDSLTFAYNADSAISSINGSALAGQGGAVLITSIQSALDPWYQTSISGLNGSAIYPMSAGSASYAWSANKAASAGAAPTGWASSFISAVTSPSGTVRVLHGTEIEGTNSAIVPSTIIEGYTVTSGVYIPVNPMSPFTLELPSANENAEFMFAFGYGTGEIRIHPDVGDEVYWNKDNEPETITGACPGATSIQVMAYDGYLTMSAYTASAATQEIGGGVGELAWASAIPTYSYDSENKISGINGSAIAGGAGGVDSATVSAIASSYAESAASGKLDSSASSSFYSTSNPSGFLTGVDLSPYQTTADMSGYMSTSMSSNFQQVTGMSSYVLSSDVSATVDLVGTQSANWGGSALALSAGPGISLTMVGSTLVISTAGV